jgi:lipopolysaccharide transport system ATP-binding protein
MGVVSVTNIAKAYKQYPNRWSRLADWLLPSSQPRHVLKWVLQDISFTIRPGEAVGIIGLNGAGKSTLLKIITGTTQPTMGNVTITGRVAALLELGLGFHPDFTGRQNALMAGQLLGYSSSELGELMDSIIAFSEIGDYLDQPLRVYSSGMQMRLAFSVATAYRPDVLIVDEALSVGDAYFQHKSFNRIREYQKQGTTLLLVSQDKQAIQSICDRALLLRAGCVVMEGAPEAVLDYYNALLSEHQDQTLSQSTHRNGQVKTVSGTGEAMIQTISLSDLYGNILESVFVGQRVLAKISVQVNEDIDSLVLGCGIKDRLGQMMYGTNTYHTGQILTQLKKGDHYIFEVEFSANLGVGSYSVHASLTRNHTHLEKNYHWVDGALVFEVFNKDRVEFIGCSWNEMSFAFVKVKKGNDLNLSKHNHCTSKYEAALDRKLVVVDVGCRWGFAQKFMDKNKLFQVIGFDPDIEECHRLTQHYSEGSVTLVPVALAEFMGTRTLYITQEPACSSLLQPDPYLTANYPALACARHVSSTEINTTTLDIWASLSNVPIIDYIKIDTQGTELEILKGGVEVLKKVRSIEIEVEFNPIYLRQAVFSDVDAFLRNQGFVLWKLNNQVHYSRDGTTNDKLGNDQIFYDDKQVVSHTVYGGQLYWANACYVKKDILSAKQRSEAEVALDIVLFDALGMPDVIDHLRDANLKVAVE